MHGLIHRHLHKQKEQGQASQVPPGAWLAILEKVTLIAGVIGPLMVVPQIYKIFAHHNASGVSALSWFAFGVLDIPFLLYGAAHKDKPIIITYTLWLIANFIVAFGAIAYR